MWRVFVLMLGGLFGPLVATGDAREKPVGDYVKKIVTVEVRGTLEVDNRDIIRPYDASMLIKVDGKEYFLAVGGDKKVSGKAKDLLYQKVIVTGTLEPRGNLNFIHVTKIEGSPHVIACFDPETLTK